MSSTVVHLNPLIQAGFITPTSCAKGMPVWLEPGLVAADLLVALFIRQLREAAVAGNPKVVRYPPLVSAAHYRQIYSERQNVYTLQRRAAAELEMARADNMLATVVDLERRRERGPVVAVGGLLRPVHGKLPPLFRDRYIWPAVQTNALVVPAEAEAELHRYRVAVEHLLYQIGLPSLTIEVPPFPGYSRLSWLVVSCLASGQPTVLATLYVLSDELTQRVGALTACIDVGFTGKVLAVAAQHHYDRAGLALPSTLAPNQVALLYEEAAQQYGTTELARLREVGLRVTGQVVPAGARQRVERRYQRRGTPLILGVRADDRVVVSARCPVRRHEVDRRPLEETISQALATHNQRLLKAAELRWRSTMLDAELLTYRCDCCQGGRYPVLGRVVPLKNGTCSCGSSQGWYSLVNEKGRLY